MDSRTKADLDRYLSGDDSHLIEDDERYFTHWDWFNNVTTVYRLSKETPKMVFGVPHPNGGEERRFSKHRIRWC